MEKNKATLLIVPEGKGAFPGGDLERGRNVRDRRLTPLLGGIRRGKKRRVVKGRFQDCARLPLRIVLSEGVL